MGFTVHYIDKNWKLQKKILGVSRIYGPHNSMNLGLAFNDVFSRNLYYNVTCVVTDNARNITASVNHLEFESFECVVHTIQLCIKHYNTFGDIVNLIEKCKTLVTHFHHSVKFTKIFSRDEYPTISLVFPLLKIIIDKLNEI